MIPIFTKFAKLELREKLPTKEAVTKTASLAHFEFTPEPDMLYVSARAISSRVNANYDGWPADELRKAWKTFIGKPCYVDHHNHDYKKARGVIIDAKLHEGKLASGEDDTWIELLFEVDAKAFPKLAQSIMNGDIDAVSMGADVEYTKCSVCGNQAGDTREFCAHIPMMKGKKVIEVDRKTGNRLPPKLCWEDCYGVRFFECSFVFDPADESADVFEYLLAGKGTTSSRRIQRHLRRGDENVTEYRDRVASIAKIARSSYPTFTNPDNTFTITADTVDMTIPNPVDTLRNESTCQQCGKEFDGMVCENCGFEQPPMELDDPNTDPSGITTEIRQDAEQNALNPGAEVPSDPNDPGAQNPNDPTNQDQFNPEAPIDPNNPQAVDPNTVVDPNAPVDPNKQQQVDPNAPVDPNADPNVVNDPKNLDPNNKVPQLPEDGSPKPPNPNDAGSPDPAPLNKPNPKNIMSPNQNIPQQQQNVPTFPEKDVKNPVDKQEDSQEDTEKDDDDSKKKKKKPPFFKEKKKGGNVSRFKKLVAQYQTTADGGALDTSGTQFNTVTDYGKATEEGTVPAPQDSLPDSAEVKEEPATVDVENLDTGDVTAPTGQSEVNVPGDNTEPAHASKGFSEEEKLARRRARARALAKIKQADEVRKTDVTNVDSNPATEEEARTPDETTDPTVPEAQGNQLDLADRPDTVNSGPDTTPKTDNPFNTVGPYPKSSSKTLEAFNLVTKREKLGLSREANRFAEVARLEAMSEDEFKGFVAAHDEFDNHQKAKAAKRVRVARREENRDEENNLNIRRASRLPLMGELGRTASSSDDELPDYLLTL